jgi:hypothetical protein
VLLIEMPNTGCGFRVRLYSQGHLGKSRLPPDHSDHWLSGEKNYCPAIWSAPTVLAASGCGAPMCQRQPKIDRLAAKWFLGAVATLL